MQNRCSCKSEVASAQAPTSAQFKCVGGGAGGGAWGLGPPRFERRAAAGRPLPHPPDPHCAVTATLKLRRFCRCAAMTCRTLFVATHESIRIVARNLICTCKFTVAPLEFLQDSTVLNNRHQTGRGPVGHAEREVPQPGAALRVHRRQRCSGESVPQL
jgi:hypothetical protein